MTTDKPKRQRRSAPADNVSVSARIPRKTYQTMEGISRSTGLTINALAAMAIDNYLHMRGAYEPYVAELRREITASINSGVPIPPPLPTSPAGIVAAGMAAMPPALTKPPTPSVFDLPEADED